MGILAIIIAVLAFAAVQSLRKRVEVLEKNINTQSIQGLNSAEQHQEKIETEDSKEHPEELVLFIKEQQRLNVPESDILSTLMQSGWKESDVLGAISYIKNKVEPEVAREVTVSAPKENAFLEW
ncbi:hypothetical protein MNBD_BACTEROID05-736, partial [hydrothermal vent metagenome]